MCRRIQVGVSNYNSDQVLRTIDAAREARPQARLESDRILPLEAAARDGSSRPTSIKRCAQHGVAIMAYSPLAMGRLCGKTYSEKDDNRSASLHAPATRRSELSSLIGKLQEVGKAHGGATQRQVALAWTIAKGCVPIAGAKTAEQAKENVAAALRWSLTG